MLKQLLNTEGAVSIARMVQASGLWGGAFGVKRRGRPDCVLITLGFLCVLCGILCSLAVKIWSVRQDFRKRFSSVYSVSSVVSDSSRDPPARQHESTKPVAYCCENRCVTPCRSTRAIALNLKAPMPASFCVPSGEKVASTRSREYGSSIPVQEYRSRLEP
jgi:hypothetical protein